MSGNRDYSLLTEEEDNEVAKTQSYETSFLAHAYEPFLNLTGALNTRYNAAKIDRLNALIINLLNPVVGANYTCTIAQTLKRHGEAMQKRR